MCIQWDLIWTDLMPSVKAADQFLTYGTVEGFAFVVSAVTYLTFYGSQMDLHPYRGVKQL